MASASAKTVSATPRPSGAYVAFDLDSTLGFFEFTNPLAYLWSPEYLENPEQAAPNAPLVVSPVLRKKLERARATFAAALADNEDLCTLVLRPNLVNLIHPLLRLKAKRLLRTVIIYSNTSVTYSMELAAAMIERRFRAPRLFALKADHWHPLRTHDHPNGSPPSAIRYVEPLKTIETLQRLFQAATGERRKAKPSEILFVDDRPTKHALTAQEPTGLTYLQCSSFVARATLEQKKMILALALSAMDKVGLLENEEYLNSGFCHRRIPYDWTKVHEIRGFPDLFRWVWNDMQGAGTQRRGTWRPDTLEIVEVMRAFSEKIEATA